MTTKAEIFRAKQQRRANPAKAKSPSKPRRDFPVDTARVGVSSDDRKAGILDTADRNRMNADKTGAALESSETGQPSRKSTRGAAGGVKRTDNLRQRAVSKARSPKQRAVKAQSRQR